MKKLLLVDGNALMHRAYHAIPHLTTSKGEQVNAIFGFTSLFLRALADLKPEYAAFAFDRPTPTFRHAISKDYKATRQKMEEDLANQIPRLKELVNAFDLPIYELDGFEADDLIGTLAREATDETKDVHTYIMTADMDAAQLVNSRVSIYTAKQKLSEVVTYDEAGIELKFNGLKPSQIVDYKSLRGDTSDNIPGVPGIGEKTAVDLLLRYQNLDNIYQNLAEIKERTQQLLETGKDSAYQSQKLAKIDTRAPIELDLEECHIHRVGNEQVRQLFQVLEFRSLISKLPANNQQDASQQTQLFNSAAAIPPQTKSTLTKDATELQKILDLYQQAKVVAVDTEVSSLDVWNGQLLGVSLSASAGEGVYVPFAEWSKPLLKNFLENPHIAKVAHHAKFDLEVLTRNSINVENVIFDTMLAAYLLKEGIGKFGLKELTFNELGIAATPITELIGTGAKQISMSDLEPDKIVDYAAADADHTFQLYKIYQAQFDEQPKLKKLFEEIEMPVALVLAKMEETGVLLDTSLLSRMSEELGKQLTEIEQKIYENVGHQFNLNSPKQLAEVLFDELNLPHQKKTKTGRSTDESVLQSLKQAHPAVSLLLQYRELFKLKSTYVDALPALISQHDGRLHTSYNQAVAATGRLSSSNPNLQNIPIRTEEGRKIRQAFIADPGQQLLSVDYSQIELRLLAHMSQDPALIAAFKAGQDVHTATAAKVFKVDPESVTKDQRRAAKTINFGIMYGQSAHGLAGQLGIPRDQAAAFIEDYFKVYAGVKDYLKTALIQAHQQGYVETLYGRRRRVPDLSSGNYQIRSAAERMAINMPIQGTAADIIKKAMVGIHYHFAEHKVKSRMLLQVHDELVFTLDPSEEKEIIPLIKHHMQHAADLSVGLEVEAKIGPNWGEMVEGV